MAPAPIMRIFRFIARFRVGPPVSPAADGYTYALIQLFLRRVRDQKRVDHPLRDRGIADAIEERWDAEPGDGRSLKVELKDSPVEPFEVVHLDAQWGRARAM